MSFLKMVIAATFLMVSFANAETQCRYKDGKAIYQLDKTGQTYVLTAKTDIPLETVMEELKIDQMIEDGTLSDDDISSLLEAIDGSGLEGRGFSTGDKMTITPGTTVLLEMTDGASVAVDLSAGIYSTITDVIANSEANNMKPGACN